MKNFDRYVLVCYYRYLDKIEFFPYSNPSYVYDETEELLTKNRLGVWRVTLK